MVTDKFELDKPSSKQEDDLLKYLSGDMNESERYQFELDNQDDPFWNEAVDGLMSVADKQRLQRIQSELQLRLRTSTNTRSKRRKNDFTKYAIVAIFVVLLMGVIGYLILHYSVK